MQRLCVTRSRREGRRREKGSKNRRKSKAKENKEKVVTVIGVAGMSLGYGLMLSGDPMKARTGGEK